MNASFVLSLARWEWLIWTLLALAGSVGLLAVFSPRLFSVVNAWSSTWIDSDKFTKRLDRRIDIEQHAIRHSRLLGAMTVLAAGVLAALFLRFHHAGQWVVLTSLGFVGATGLVALFSPRLFARLASWGSLWIDTYKLLESMDRRIDIDAYVVRHCRLFGVAVLGAVIILASLLIYTA